MLLSEHAIYKSGDNEWGKQYLFDPLVSQEDNLVDGQGEVMIPSVDIMLVLSL